MGEVYRARDPRLGRDVAIKVLPAHLADDEHALARFEREARVVAALSHPNILAIHDFGTDQGVAFAVMELLDGRTLREALAESPLPWRKAVGIAVQLADGLAAAHAKHVVHRDLKPENIFLTASGQAKILDFGLARVAGGASIPDATTLGGATQPGTVMGTVGYMSPEQVRGEEAGPASDVFAFGCVFYEMLTGRGPFTRPTPAETMAAVLRDDPASLADQVAGVPPAVEAILAHCLEKRPEDRFQAARDMGVALRAAGGLTSAATGVVSSLTGAVQPPHHERRRWALPAAAAAGLLVGVVAASAWWRLAAPAPTPAALVHLSLPLSPGAPLAPNDHPAAGSSLAVSQDGHWIAYVVLRNGQRQVALRGLDRSEETILAGTEGALTPIFSPDSQWVAFFTETGLKKVPLLGGTATTVCATPPVTRGGVWADDGTIYFAPDFSRGLQAVASSGGQARDVTRIDLEAGESNHLLPEALPGAQSLLFTVWKGGDFAAASIWSLSLATGERKRLLESAAAPRYVPPGYLVFARAGALFAVRFDAERLSVTGEAVPVVDGVWSDRATGTAHYAVSRNGMVVYAPGGNTVERRRLVWVDRKGRAELLPAEPGFYGDPRLSPDGRRIAVEALNDIWVYSLESGTLSRVSFRGVSQHPAWAPDGRHLAFSSSHGFTVPKLFWTDVDAGSQPQPLSRDGGVQFPATWTRDGKTLSYAETAIEDVEPQTGWDIWLLRPGANPERSVLIRTQFKEEQPAFSPDGRALAYVSDETGKLEVFLRGFPETGRRVRVSVNGGTEPVWSRRGDELFYRVDRQYFAVPVTTTDPIRVGRPALMFEGDFVVASVVPGTPSYDVAPDGQRFVMVARAGDTPRPLRVDVVLGWVRDLERRLRPAQP